MKRSPLAPTSMPPATPIDGVRWSSMAAGLRYQNRDDLALIALDPGTVIAGVFTKSTTAGHPVGWCRRALARGEYARAILVNAGNANVFRGQEGEACVTKSAASLARELGCKPEEILVSSTGVIGERLPLEKLCSSLPELAAGLAPERMSDAARAIMTTDTFPKWAVSEADIEGTSVQIAGIAKGSGMIAPDMATMLSYVVTDAVIDQNALQELVRWGADRSFNSITVDSDTSTSDTLLLAATRKARNPMIDDANDGRLAGFRSALLAVMQELALMIVKDGEGAQKLIKISVQGAIHDSSARKIAKSIANSPLVKTAIAGADANWGRVIMAIGKSEQPIETDRIAIAFGGYAVAEGGSAIAGRDESLVDDYLKSSEIDIDVVVGSGPGTAAIWTCDLTHGYIDINADYRS